MLHIAAIIGGILYRLRGGVLKELWPHIFGTQLSRLAWALPTAALMTEMAHAPWWLSMPLTVTHWSSLTMFGTGQYLPENAKVEYPDLLGFYRNALAALPVFYFAPLMFGLYAVVGSLHSVFYWLGHRTGHGSQAGECIAGAASWSIIALCR
jgi:hypothetical protein